MVSSERAPQRAASPPLAPDMLRLPSLETLAGLRAGILFGLPAAVLLNACSSTTTGPVDPAEAGGKDPAEALVLAAPTDQWTVRLDAERTLRFEREPFRLIQATIGPVSFQPTRENSQTLAVNDKGAAGIHAASQWRAEKGALFALHVTASDRDGAVTDPQGRRLTESVESASVGSATGYRRSLHQDPEWDPQAGGRDWPPAVTFGGGRFSELGPTTVLVSDHYGWSTVSDPGVTYEVLTYDLEGGDTLWVYRAFLHSMNQALNPGIDPAMTEVVLVAPAESPLDLASLVEALVEEPRDRASILASDRSAGGASSF